MRCLIVGTGPSIKDLSVPIEADYIIAVNQAIRYFDEQDRKPDAWFTLDPSNRNLAVARHYIDLYPRCKFYIACDSNIFLDPWIYKLKRVSIKHEKHKNVLERLGCVKTLSDKPGYVNTGNSVWGALQLAYWMDPSKIAILGLDATQQPSHISNHSPYTLSHLPELFESSIDQLSAKGIKVVNGSPQSRVECFDKCSPNQAIEWINLL